jgi:DNA-binding transcriptional MerR regulator
MNKEEQTYTPSAVSKMIGVSAATLRRYAGAFSEHLSDKAKVEGKKRYYTYQDVLILSRIRDLVRSRTPESEIPQLLQVIDPGETLPEPPTQETALEIIDLNQKFNDLQTAIMSAQQEQSAQYNEFRADIATSQMSQSSDIHALRAEIQELKKLIQDPLV